MARKKLCILILPVMLILGFSQIAAQVATTSSDLFIPVRTIGANRPGGLRYDPNFDRFAWVDAQGQLVIVDAVSLAPLHILYPTGAFADFSFSRSGHLLAVAIDVRIDVWDVESGALVARFEPAGARRVQGPLQFTRNDELLLFDSIVPAPQELRRSENDTVILPWVWDIAAAREQRNSVLVNRAAAYPFYNVRVSMVAGDNGVLVSGIDNHIQVYDADTPSMQMIADLPADRLETDPVDAWRSATDPYLYVRLTSYGTVAQIDTLTNETRILELGIDLDLPRLDELGQLAFSRAEQPIGERTNQMNPLAQLLLGSDYASQQGYTSALFNLLDVLLPTNDDPQIDSASGTSLLVYHFDEHHGTGSADLLHPPDVNQIVLSPDNTRLAMRRQSGQVEIYTIATGALERIISPSEPDPEGRRPLAYTRDGRTLVVDFERYDAATGERLTRAANYTQPFDAFTFTSESQLITFGGSPLNSIQESALPWRIWDIESGQLLREDSAIFRGDTTLAVSPDRLRILTETITSESGAELYIVDYRANSAQTIPIPPLANAVIQSIIPNDAWSRFIVVYASNNPSAGNPIAVYTRDGERLYFDAGNNLPRDVFSYGWRDDRTVIIQAYAGVAPTPIIGLAYHPSGLPQCIVDALPDSWQALVPDWERLVYTYLPERVNDIARQLCTALTGEGARNVNAAQGTPVIPADLTAVASLLTPSPTVEYRSARTPAPISVPGVPACITSVYRSQAAAYAELWRQITANVTDPEQLAEINIMICEGLLSSLGGVQPTPTVNPNALVVATPTSPPAGPETTGGDENTFDVMTINVETGARTIASSVVPPGAPDNPDPLALLSTFFYQQYQVYPADPAISPDGRYMAARSRDGFVTIYRLARAVPELVQDEQNAAATRAAQEPRSLGLAPTPSQLPQALGAARPTLTPTVTITPIPFAGMDTTLPQWGESQFVCPARSLAKAPALPGSFAPPGTLIVSPARAYASGDFLWTLDPRTGKLTGDAQRPPCGVSEMCSLSPDGIWLVRQGQAGDVVVSRADGSDAVTLYTPPETSLVEPSFTWREPHTLQIRYSGMLPTVSPHQLPLIRTYDPETGVLTHGTLSPTSVPFGLLPFETVSRQPYGTLELLIEYFAGGTRYYLRDSATHQAQPFAQGDLSWEWQPAGRFLYYSPDGFAHTYVYDTLTQQHTRLGALPLPGGTWSPDGHLRANWTDIAPEEIEQALMQGKLPPRLQVWNSDAGLLYTYCLPEMSSSPLSGNAIFWSPDSRYLAFTVNMQPDADIAPTPTFAISPEAPPATSTPIPLETRYDYQFPRTIILDTMTGNAAVVSVEAGMIQSWMGD